MHLRDRGFQKMRSHPGSTTGQSRHKAQRSPQAGGCQQIKGGMRSQMTLGTDLASLAAAGKVPLRGPPSRSSQ